MFAIFALKKFASAALAYVVLTVLYNLYYYYYLVQNTAVKIDAHEMDKIASSKLPQNDPHLLHFLNAPSLKDYNLTIPWENHPAKKEKMSRNVLRFLNGKRKGFFVEINTDNIDHLSTTLTLERDFGWNGLVVQPDPLKYSALLAKNRKAWTSPACLSTVPRHVQVGARANIHQRDHLSTKAKSFDVVNSTCLPLFTLLSALKVNMVDYFYLNMGGAVLEVLKTFPFNSVYIKMISINYCKMHESRLTLKMVMESEGFMFVQPMQVSACNDLFIHDNLFE